MTAVTLEELDDSLRIGRLLSINGRDWLRGLVAHYEKDLSNLRRRHQSQGDTRRQIKHIMESASGRICAIARVAAAGKYEGLCHWALSRAELESRAAELDLTKRLKGFAGVKRQPKGNGGDRLIVSYSGNVRAAQLLVGDILTAQEVANEFDANIPGKGRLFAAHAISDAIEAGYTEWLIFDLKNCFPALRPPHMTWLPIPGRVIHTTLFPNGYLTMKDQDLSYAEKNAVRLGLPPGASLSGQTASAFIGRETQACLAEDTGAISYVDDVAVCARTPDRVIKDAGAIRDRFENHPAGPLSFKHFNICSADTGFDFLQFRFLRQEDGSCLVRPSASALERMQRKLRLLLSSEQTTDYDKLLKKADEFCLNWTSSQQPWTPSELEVAEMEAMAATFAADAVAKGKAKAILYKTKS